MKKILILLLCLVSNQLVFAQDYVAQPIGFNPPNSYIQIGVPVCCDDNYSQVINLDFDFEFYGTVYQQVVIGTNGVISFDISNAGNYCPWAFDTDIPDVLFPILNAVLGPYHDMDESASNEDAINFGTYGTIPNRRFVVNFFRNAHFSSACNQLETTVQMVLYETTNNIEIFMKDKPVCTVWNGGNAVLGVINADGSEALAAAGRNTSDSPWEATNEAWRFSFFTGTTVEAYNATLAICDMGNGGFESFDLSLIESEVIGNQAGVTVSFHLTFLDANNDLNPLINPYMNTANPQIIYARVEDNQGLYATSEVTLEVIQCFNFDDDQDGVDTSEEDLNGDGFPGNDDTDNDGIPNYLDIDDDNDWVDTSIEITGIGAGFNGGSYSFIDTDEDSIENYLDNDDDGDAIITTAEDYNGNGDPLDDDQDNDGIPDFLDADTILSTTDLALQEIAVIPNPFYVSIDIHFPEGLNNIAIDLMDITGRIVYSELHERGTQTKQLNLSNLAAGMYLMRFNSGGNSIVKQIVKK